MLNSLPSECFGMPHGHICIEECVQSQAALARIAIRIGENINAAPIADDEIAPSTVDKMLLSRAPQASVHS